ncbi:hypothetical protein GCM10011391_37680 [Pullulanibacillus camelliae]|uniref:YcxB-like C-terminal domain-containing protein n=1 Tax=Pullulanibacillus camelliae TaxID=1707096 RepID=A0A8J2YN81_9BACL|nr:YcxB family protein [Pullulanibacillus camelliae]GGE55151.1 hypothetical protein GCM10011391_37680 [Pullulanibacillus camelliae]
MTIEFQLTLNDVMTLHRYHMKHKSKEFKVQLVVSALVVPIIFAAFMYVTKGFETSTIIINSIISLAWFIMVPFVLYQSQLSKIKRKLQKQQKKGQLEVVKPCEINFSERGIKSVREYTTFQVDWEHIIDFVETNHFYYLYYNDSSAMILPKEIGHFNIEENHRYQRFVKEHLKPQL